MVLLASLSSRLHDICTYVIYREVHVVDHRARRFLTTMLSRSSTSQGYPNLVRRFTYVVGPSIQACLAYSMLGYALAKMENLATLGIFIPPTCCDSLIQSFSKLGLIHQGTNLFNSLKIKYNDTGTAAPYFLPRLRELNIRGDVELSQLCRLRNITTLRILDPMDFTDLSTLSNNLSSNAAKDVKNLEIGATYEAGGDIIHVLVKVNEAFPNLTHFGIKAPYMSALVSPHTSRSLESLTGTPIYFPQTMSKCLAENSSLFTNAVEIKFNQNSSDTIFASPRAECLETQEDDIAAAGHSRPALTAVTFGRIRWERMTSTSAWSMDDDSHDSDCTKHSTFNRDRNYKSNPLDGRDDSDVIYYSTHPGTQ